MTLRKTLLSAICAGVLLAPAFSHADDEHDADYYKKQLEGWSSVIAELQKMDTRNASSEEVEHVRNLVSQGQAFLAAEKLEEIDPLLEHGAALAALVRARSHRLEMEAQAKAAMEAATQAETAAKAAHEATAAAEKRFEELESKGL